MDIATVILTLIGFGMFLASAFFRAPDAPPIPSFNLKHWTPIWKPQSNFRGPGFRLMVFVIDIFGLSFLFAPHFPWLEPPAILTVTHGTHHIGRGCVIMTQR